MSASVLNQNVAFHLTVSMGGEVTTANSPTVPGVTNVMVMVSVRQDQAPVTPTVAVSDSGKVRI